MHATVTLTDKMAFDTEVDGHHFIVDAADEHGGADLGPRPKTLVLAALAGCAAMDIISILRKMRQAPDTLVCRAEADHMAEDHPKTLEDLTVFVEATGDVDPKRLWRAASLSRDKYCGVAAMLRAHTTVSTRVFLNGEEIPEPDQG